MFFDPETDLIDNPSNLPIDVIRWQKLLDRGSYDMYSTKQLELETLKQKVETAIYECPMEVDINE